MQTQTNTTVAKSAPVSFTDSLMADLEAHPYWNTLKEKAAAVEEAGKGKKKSRFETIVEKKEGGTFYANPTFFKMKDEWNFRTASPKFIAGIKILAAQIAAEGMKTPVKAFHEGNDPTFWLEDGHRRTIALAYAIVHLDYAPESLLIPFRMGDKVANDTDRIFSQFRDNQSEKPTPFEMARIFGRMVNMGAKKEDIAFRAGISKSNVIRLLDMATVPASLQAFTEKDIEVADSFVHKLYNQTGKKADIAINALEIALITAKDQGYDRVMPKHLPADVLALYNAEKPGKGKKAQPAVPAPAPANDTPKADAAPDQDEGDTGSAAPEGQDNNPPQDASPQGSATTQPANDTAKAGSTAPAPAQASTPAATPKADASKGSGELPVQSSHGPTTGEKNIKMRVALTEFFKHNVQIAPIDPDNPEAPRKLILVKDTIDVEASFAILHNLNLD